MSWRTWFSRGQRDREREEELREHITHHEEDLMARGMPAEEAKRQARLLFGNPRVRREEMDDMLRLPVMETLVRDLRYAVRILRRTPAFTLTAVATLALVIGANTAVFSLANALLLTPLPFPASERLAMVSIDYRSPRGSSSGLAIDGATWQALSTSGTVTEAAVFTNWTAGVNIVVNNQARFVDQQRVGAGFFGVLGTQPAMGREFTAEEDVPGGPAVAILSHDLWARTFGGASNILGQSILLRGEPWTVVGVMPEGFRSTVDADVWTPLRPTTTGEGGGTNYGAIVRVAEGQSIQEAVRRLPDLGPHLRSLGAPADTQVTVGLQPLNEVMAEDNREPIVMLGAAVATVLVIACVNLAALLLARGGARSKEIATRMALGSGRTAVVRQLMAESVVLAVVGGAAGVVVAQFGLQALQALGGDRFADWQRATIDGRVLLVCGGLSLLTSVCFGLVPAWQASRLDVQTALLEGGNRSIAGGARHWTRRGLIVAQVALGVVLLVSAGLLVRTFINLQSLTPGFNPAGLTTATVSLLDARYPGPTEVNVLFEKTLERLRGTPGVSAAAVSLGLPYERVLNMGFRYPGEDSGRTASVMYISPDFFRTFEIALKRGRDIHASDNATSRPVVIVNESFARFYSKDKDVVGRVLRLSGVEREVVGLVSDIQMRPGFQVSGMVPGPITASPTVYLPAAQVTPGIVAAHVWFPPVFTVRASSPEVAARALTDAITGADALLPVGQIREMMAVRGEATAEHSMLMILVGALALVALLLAAVGLHGLIAHSVSERTREFGIRLALGATPSGAVRTVALSGITLAAIGAGLGLLMAVPATTLVASVLYGVAERDPLTFVAAAAFLFVVAAIASVLPALRILRLDPATTLRQ